MKASRRYLFALALAVVALAGVYRDQITSPIRQFCWLVTAADGLLRDEAEAEAWSARGHEYLHSKNAEGALLCFLAATEFDDRQPKYLQDLANGIVVFRKDAHRMFALSEHQAFDMAIVLYEKAMQLAPADFELARDYGSTFYLMRPARPEQARRAWEVARRSARDDYEREEAEMHLARLDILEGLFDSASSRLMLVMHDDHMGLRETLTRRIIRERTEYGRRHVLPVKKV